MCVYDTINTKEMEKLSLELAGEGKIWPLKSDLNSNFNSTTY